MHVYHKAEYSPIESLKLQHFIYFLLITNLCKRRWMVTNFVTKQNHSHRYCSTTYYFATLPHGYMCSKNKVCAASLEFVTRVINIYRWPSFLLLRLCLLSLAFLQHTEPVFLLKILHFHIFLLHLHIFFNHLYHIF